VREGKKPGCIGIACLWDRLGPGYKGSRTYYRTRGQLVRGSAGHETPGRDPSSAEAERPVGS